MAWLSGCWHFVTRHVRRTLASDLRSLEVNEGEGRRLRARGVEEGVLPRYLVWRRSILLTAAAATLVHAVIYSLTAFEFAFPRLWTPAALFVQGAHLASLYAIPLAALVGWLAWARPGLSRAVILGGWLTSLLIPVALSFVPTHWLFNLDALAPSEQRELLQELLRAFDVPASVGAADGALRSGLRQMLDAVGAVVYALLLMPSVFALIPGVTQACVRVKLLLPASIVPGWFLIAVTPVYVLLALILFGALASLDSSPLLLAGGVLLTAAPLVYLADAPRLTRPVSSAGEVRRIRRTQLAFTGVFLLGLTLALGYLLTLEVTLFGERFRVVGWGEEAALMRHWDLLIVYVEFFGRSLFTTAVMADVFLRINLSVWRQLKQFEAAEQRVRYDEEMSGLAQALDGAAGAAGAAVVSERGGGRGRADQVD